MMWVTTSLKDTSKKNFEYHKTTDTTGPLAQLVRAGRS